ncbi:transketolase C-terminal domain-containing protein [Streptomyces sp. NPDC059477]|uniref:transketolase C-terminal domain-containing protein n=1 Tax=Streptomyces sp. NPDC059477 TaxID=3346847 RepID=UPI00369FFF91
MRPGDEVTAVTSSFGVELALRAAEALADEISVEVIDLRTLEPLDVPTVLASVRRTRRTVVVDQDTDRGGLAAELAAVLSTACFGSLLAPVQRVARLAVPAPGGLAGDSVPRLVRGRSGAGQGMFWGSGRRWAGRAPGTRGRRRSDRGRRRPGQQREVVDHEDDGVDQSGEADGGGGQGAPPVAAGMAAEVSDDGGRRQSLERDDADDTESAMVVARLRYGSRLARA